MGQECIDEVLQKAVSAGSSRQGQANISVHTGDLGLLLQALANVLHLGEIDMPASQADRSACRIAQGGHTRANPAIGAILVPQAVLDLVLRKLPAKQAMHRPNPPPPALPLP